MTQSTKLHIGWVIIHKGAKVPLRPTRNPAKVYLTEGYAKAGLKLAVGSREKDFFEIVKVYAEVSDDQG